MFGEGGAEEITRDAAFCFFLFFSFFLPSLLPTRLLSEKLVRMYGVDDDGDEEGDEVG